MSPSSSSSSLQNSHMVDRRMPAAPPAALPINPMHRMGEPTMWSEARAVAIGVLGSLGLRLVISQLSNLAESGPTSSSEEQFCTHSNWGICSSSSSYQYAATFVWNMLGMIVSVLARCCVWLLPHTTRPNKTMEEQTLSSSVVVAVGFSLTNVWWLLWIRQRTLCYAHLPTRLCEVIMWRLSWRRFCFVVLPIHILVTMVIVWSCQKVLGYATTVVSPASAWSQMALEPVLYSSQTPWWMLMLRETVVTTLFIVIMLVLPELLRVNRLPIWPCGFVLYPLYSFVVDTQQQQQPSTFHPIFLFTLTSLAKSQPLKLLLSLTSYYDWKNFDWIIPIAPNLIGSMLGGWMAGHVMRIWFPDGPKRS